MIFKQKHVRTPHHINRKNVLNPNTKFAITEAYKTARTNLMFSLATASEKVVVFSSCSPVEGKSTTCVNIALALSQTGSRVLIIDADMRKPTVHNLLRVNHTMGLSTVLGKFSQLPETIKMNVSQNLDVIIAGPIPPNPAELLASPQMASALTHLKECYDYILIDTPPVGLVSDALIINKLAAGIVFVVREGYTTHGELAKSLQSIELAEGKVLGFIKVGCNPKNSSHYKKYNYDNNYEYK